MAIRKTHRIISLMMAMLVFVSSTGFSIDVHYCQGKIKSFSLFGEAHSCHQQVKKEHCTTQQKACHASPVSHEDSESCKKRCCSNKTFQVESNDDAKNLQALEFSSKQVKFLTAFVEVFLLERTNLSKLIIPYLNYVPPLLNKNISVLIQSFLL